MKHLVAALALTAALVGLITQAQAQALGVKCQALTGTPYLCVKNDSNYSVVSIQASTGTTPGARWLSMPGGPLLPRETVVVKFDTSWGTGNCWQNVYVRDASGQSHAFMHLEVCRTTGIIIR